MKKFNLPGIQFLILTNDLILILSKVRMKLLRILFLFPFLFMLHTQIFAEDQVHNELRKFKIELEDALKEKDISKILPFIHPNAVVTFANAEAVRGPEGVANYLKRMLDGPNKIVNKFGTTISVDELTILYGGGTVGISFGGSDDFFELTEGISFHSKSRWTATLVKEKGKWMIASAHVSMNLFDNPLLTAAKNSMYWVASFTFLLGLLLGFLSTRLFSKKG